MEYDIEGNEVREYSRIAAAFRVGNQAELRIGTVTGFGTRKRDGRVVGIIHVHWDKRSGYQGVENDMDQQSWIYDAEKRYVVLA